MERPEETYAVPPSSKKRKSVVWNDFEEVTIDGKLKAKCKNCKKQFDGSSKNGTTHLKNHLSRCSSTKAVETCKKMQNTCLEIANVVENFVFDDKRSHLDMARMIIMHGYSLDMVKHEYFKIFLKNLQPSFKLLPQDALKDNILRVYKEEKKKLYEYLGTLSCHFSLIIQFSTCHRKKNVYCCLVLQFIEDGLILNKKILAFKQVDQCHDLAAETLFETVKSMLLEWNIDNKLCSITLSSSQSDKMVPNLKIWLDLARKLPLCGYFFHVHCTTDILNRLCQDGLKVVDGIIGKRMNNARYVKEERLHWELNFDQTQEQHYFQGKYSVSPRLDSVLLKLDALMEKNQFLLDCDVAVVSEFSKLLHVVSSISGRKCLTINVYFHHISGIHFKILELQKSKHQDICKIADEMKNKFDEYFDKCGTGLAIASILDPSKNWKYVTYAINECYGKEAQRYLTKIEDALKNIFDNYEKELGKQASSSSGATHTGSIFTSYPDVSNYDKLNISWREETCRDTKVASRNELKQYLAKPYIGVNGEFDILDWWRTNGKEFPTLRKMALDILGIPMSMDYDFNIEDTTKIIDPASNGLHSDIIEALICAKDWLDMSTKNFRAPNKKDEQSSRYTLDGEPKDRDHTSMAMGEPSLSNRDPDQDKPYSIDKMALTLGSGHQHGTQPHGTLLGFQEPDSQEPLPQPFPHLSNCEPNQENPDTNMYFRIGSEHQNGTAITPQSLSSAVHFTQVSHPLHINSMPTQINNIPSTNSSSENSTPSAYLNFFGDPFPLPYSL